MKDVTWVRWRRRNRRANRRQAERESASAHIFEKAFQIAILEAPNPE